jgi:adenylate cyclase
MLPRPVAVRTERRARAQVGPKHGHVSVPLHIRALQYGGEMDVRAPRGTWASRSNEKFLVRDDSWRSQITCQQEIRDGLIAIAGSRKVRIRICDRRATLAVKSKTTGLANTEFEYEIPLADAEEMIAHHCLRAGLAKTRYVVPYGDHTWQVDVYRGILAGVVLAEVELPSETTALALPPWVGREVTGDPASKKTNMVNALLGSALEALHRA